MKHLKAYNENVSDDLKDIVRDILSDLSDDEFNIHVKDQNDYIYVLISRRLDFRYEDISSSVDHLTSYFKENNYFLREDDINYFYAEKNGPLNNFSLTYRLPGSKKHNSY